MVKDTLVCKYLKYGKLRFSCLPGMDSLLPTGRVLISIFLSPVPPPCSTSSFAMLVIASLWPVLNRRWRIAGVLFVLRGGAEDGTIC
jgi:hypothetical protein